MTTLRPTLPTRRPRPLALLAASAVVVAGSYLAAAFGAPQPPPVRAPAAAVAAPQPLVASGTGQLLDALDHEIGQWAEGLAASPANFIAAGRLGQLTLQRARITGDLGDYQRALEAADRAIEADPIYWEAHALRASVLFALHDFAAAREEAETTLAADRDQLDALAVVGDASLELGDLEGASAAYAELAEVAPSPPAWSRLAHLAFVRGQPDEALELVERCLAATPATEEPAAAAFYAFQLGELHRSGGRLAEAAAAYERSLAALDGYVPAIGGLAHVRAAQGDRSEAIELLEHATAVTPQPELVAALGDLYALEGDARAAEERYALVERIGELGGVYDRQLVVFAADHARRLDEAVAAAQAGLAIRRDVYGLDAAAWALFAAGRLDEAAELADEALAVGTADPRIAYHAGMIAAADGRATEARRLLAAAVAGRAALPPLQAERAVAALGELDGTADR